MFSVNLLPTFRDTVSVPSLGVKMSNGPRRALGNLTVGLCCLGKWSVLIANNWWSKQRLRRMQGFEIIWQATGLLPFQLGFKQNRNLFLNRSSILNINLDCRIKYSQGRGRSISSDVISTSIGMNENTRLKGDERHKLTVSVFQQYWHFV
jgi:hypothetical protein